MFVSVMSNQPDYKSRCNHWLVTNLNQPSEPIKKCEFCQNLSYEGRLLKKTVRLNKYAQTDQVHITDPKLNKFILLDIFWCQAGQGNRSQAQLVISLVRNISNSEF